MWAKIETVHEGQNIIYLPKSLAKNFGTSTEIIFAGKSANASVQYQENSELTTQSSFENPVKIQVSDKLQNELLIAETPVYQVKISKSDIRFGPVIGLLLGDATHRYNPMHMMKYSDRFGIYHQIGGLVYAFSPKLINWSKQTAYGLFYNHITALWEYGYFPLPEVIYRRNFHTDPDVIQKLITYTGGRLFNSYRFTKYQFYDFIKLDAELSKNLPPTEYCLEFDQIRKFIHTHQKVILKPIHLSRGRGICVIEKIDSKYKVIDFRCKQPTVYELYNDELLENFFDVYQDLFNKYLMQKYISLSKINNSPFDIRIVMQKQSGQDWGCTGIECRVSNNGYLTNISRGGYALSLEEALQHTFPTETESLTRQINELSQKVCLYLDTSGEHFGEFGLDIAIDTDKKLWLIEANVFPSFKGFKKMDPEVYLAIRYKPMLYATSLTEFGE